MLIDKITSTISQSADLSKTPGKDMIAEAAGFIGIAILIGVAHYIYKVATKELPFSWARLLAESMLSGVAGYLTWSLCMSFGVSAHNMGFFVGISGWAGSKAMVFFETIAMKVIDRQLGFDQTSTTEVSAKDKDEKKN